MKTNEKTTVSDSVKVKATFEPVVIEVFTFSADDIITTSGGFRTNSDHEQKLYY